jgi:hypothetical protein
MTLCSLNVRGAGLLWRNREGTKRYYHFDGEGSTRTLTDGSQNVTETYECTSFGELIAATGAAPLAGPDRAYDDLARGSLFPLTLLQGTHCWNAETATWLIGLELRDQLWARERLTKEECREGCNGAFPKKSQEGVRRVCYAICVRLRGDFCRALWNLCQHMSRHNEQGVKICLQLYSALCLGELMNRDIQRLVEAIGLLQAEIDKLRITPSEWATEFDSSHIDGQLALLSYLHANSESADALRESDAVRSRIRVLARNATLSNRSLFAIVLALQSIRIEELAPWLEDITANAKSDELREVAQMALNHQRLA